MGTRYLQKFAEILNNEDTKPDEHLDEARMQQLEELRAEKVQIAAKELETWIQQQNEEDEPPESPVQPPPQSGRRKRLVGRRHMELQNVETGEITFGSPDEKNKRRKTIADKPNKKKKTAQNPEASKKRPLSANSPAEGGVQDGLASPPKGRRRKRAKKTESETLAAAQGSVLIADEEVERLLASDDEDQDGDSKKPQAGNKKKKYRLRGRSSETAKAHRG
eukprot:TRINITY_DN411_c0_g1_i2.p1 TRINITY_DN411_c0_g1~~TRINITY_DN411_c0_g1_i2.p1  ORF type:complete len:221 (-),score=73.93 TRINITY_DN411_c0_g1_i2:2-664(-)